MQCRLDKYVLFERDGSRRLLFETDSSYLYVWIDSGSRVAGFQFISGDRLGLVCTPPAPLQAGLVSTTPLNRAITPVDDVGLRSRYLEGLLAYESDELPGVIADVKLLASGAAVEHPLIPSEAETVGHLPHSKAHRGTAASRPA